MSLWLQAGQGGVACSNNLCVKNLHFGEKLKIGKTIEWCLLNSSFGPNLSDSNTATRPDPRWLTLFI